MATSLERMEDDLKEMVENLVDEALAKPLDGLEERIEKIEQFIANLGPLAKLSERLAETERLLTLYGLDIEKNDANVDALLEEHKLQGNINLSLLGQLNTLSDRVNTQLAMLTEALGKIATLEHQLELAQSPAESAALALYGGEQ